MAVWHGLVSLAAEVLERYYRELLAYFSGALNDREHAADVVQEAYARVLALQESGHAVREPRALLFRAARSAIIDGHRRAQVRSAAQGDAGATEEVAAPTADEPEVQLANKRAANRLLAAIEALPPRCREAFVLFKLEGLPQAEIARRMGISRNAVEKHVIAGMVACRRALRDGET
jgi:RNA polymerase sigma-70 factor (ECF subfamily)